MPLGWFVALGWLGALAFVFSVSIYGTYCTNIKFITVKSTWPSGKCS